MACFLVPLTEAVLTSAVKGIYGKVVTKSTISEAEKNLKLESFNSKVSILQKMLYGGSFLLAIEHIYHGEVVFYPPFLTAMNDPADTVEMLNEMSTVGVSMAVLVTAVWGIGLFVSHLFKKSKKAQLS
ncbi:MAG: hypothetical protein UHO11_09350 [Treponema sp.]|nr:hypothetical protein [Treponema sp.]